MAEKEFKQPHSETLADGHTQAVHVITNDSDTGIALENLSVNNLDTIVGLLSDLIEEQKMTNRVEPFPGRNSGSPSRVGTTPSSASWSPNNQRI